MGCNQYTLQDKDNRNITQEDFENFLKNNFPEFKRNGVIKFLDNSLSRTYKILDEYHQELGMIRLTYRPDTTLAMIMSRDVIGLASKLMEKNSMYWTEIAEKYKHQYDRADRIFKNHSTHSI